MGTDRQSDQVEAPNEYPDDAWRELGDGPLTEDQLAARITAKIEEAAQERGLIRPPAPDEPIEEEEAEGEPDAEEAQPEPEATEEEAAAAEEEEVDAEGEAEGEDEGDEYFLAATKTKYKTVEEAVAGIDEKDATIDRLFRQLHEQRQQTEEALQEAEEPAEVELDTDAWEEWATEAVSNGAGADGALQALRTGGREGYNLYLRHWMADEDQRGDAVAFNNEVLLELAEQRARAAVQPLEAERVVRDAALDSQAARQQLAVVYPDFNEYTEQMDALVNGGLPDSDAQFLAQMAQQPGGRLRVWEQLYMRAKLDSVPKRAKASDVERKRRRASADDAKVRATVSSAEGAPTRTPSTTTVEDIARETKNAIRREAGLPEIED